MRQELDSLARVAIDYRSVDREESEYLKQCGGVLLVLGGEVYTVPVKPKK